jgi:predicted Zn-dependent peptidase
MAQLQVFYPGGPGTDDVLAPLDDEIARLGSGDDADEELDRFRTPFLAGFLGEIDGLIPRGMLVAALEQQRGRAETSNELPAMLGEVRPADVARVCAEWLQPGKRAVLDWQPGGAK